MRSLFVKTLLTFLLANALAAAISFALSESLRPPHPAEGVVPPLVKGYAQLAVGLLEHGDAARVAQVSDELERENGIRVRVFPDDSPAHAAERERSARDGGGHQWTHRGLEIAGSVGSTSKPYRIDARVPHPRRRRPHIHVGHYWRGALALATITAVCYAFSSYLVAPVRKLQGAARTIASGDLQARVGGTVARRRDELGQLAQDFDKMADHVEALMAEQKQLFRHASHELRTPLARLQVAVGLLRQKHEDPLFDRIEHECEQLDRQIDDLLSLAKLESSARSVRRAAIDPVRLMREIATDAEFEARGRGCSAELVIEGVDVSLCVFADEAILRSALENVVRNAIRFTADGTRVSMSVVADEAPASRPGLTIVIRDRGPGVPAEQLRAVFEPFFRGREGGVGGVGLTIAKRGIEMFGGTIAAENAADGGLAVAIRLPLSGGDTSGREARAL